MQQIEAPYHSGLEPVVRFRKPLEVERGTASRQSASFVWKPDRVAPALHGD
jgi:hypothetical protein